MPRASFEEVLEFANAVRNAGGGNPLDALLPARPSDTKQCLIAKNLNFNCTVDGSGEEEERNGQVYGPWTMTVEDAEVAAKISQALNLPHETLERWNAKLGEYGRWEIVPNPHVLKLPVAIGQVASDFDSAMSFLAGDEGDIDEWSDRDRQLVQDMAPYIEASMIESALYGTLNEKGELIL